MDRIFLVDKKGSIFNDSDDYILDWVLNTYSKQYCDKVYYSNWSKVNLDLLDEKIVPVGNLNYVQKFLKNKIKPIEVPVEMLDCLHREYGYFKGQEVLDSGYLKSLYFVKSADSLKGGNNLLQIGTYNRNSGFTVKEDGTYIVSAYKPVIAEYRVFVFNGEVQDCRRYLGEPLVFLDSEYVINCIKRFDDISMLRSYTMDFMVYRDGNENITDLLEIHPFVSCGLYGFNDKVIIPMLSSAWNWVKSVN